MYFRKEAEAQTAAEGGGKGKKGKKGEAAVAPAAVAAQPSSATLALSTRSISLVVIIAALGTVAVGLWPAPWTQWIGQAVTAVFGG
jgi:hypothetical protein